MRVAVARDVDTVCGEMLAGYGYDVVYFDPRSKMTPVEALAAIVDEVGEVQGWVQRTNPKIQTPEAFDIFRKTNTLVVARAGIGLDNLNQELFSAGGICLENTAGCSTDSVADHAFYELMMKACGIAGCDYRDFALGIVGAGRIGTRVAQIASEHGMRVRAYDPFKLEPDDYEPSPYILVDKLEELLAGTETMAGVNIVSLHAELNDTSLGMIDGRCYEIWQKKGGPRILINAARGEMVVEKDLLHALDEGTVSAAGLDVLRVESKQHGFEGSVSQQLYQHPRTYVTDHVAGSRKDALTNAATMAAGQVHAFLDKGEIVNSITHYRPADPIAQQWLGEAAFAGDQVGRLNMYIRRTGVEIPDDVLIVYDGRKFGDADLRRALKKRVLHGLLTHQRPDVTPANAPAVASELGIQVSEQLTYNWDDKGNSIVLKDPETRSVLAYGMLLPGYHQGAYTYSAGYVHP